MTTYKYVPDRASRAYWAPHAVPWEDMLCRRVGGGPWRRNQLVEFLTANPDPAARGVLVVVPWRRLRRVS
jgi:hypothetical protein